MKGKTSIDTGCFFYAPYIPLILVPGSTKIEQVNNQKFRFFVDHFTESFHWLLNECSWCYALKWLDNYHTFAEVEFFEASGAVEFKLRFIE